MTRVLSVFAVFVLAGFVLAGCGTQSLVRVQEHHGREFRCHWREVRASALEGAVFRSRGCGFEAQWECAGSECTLRSSRSYGMDAP